MPLSSVTTYNTPSDLTFDNSLIEVLTSAKLKPQVNPSEIFYNNCSQLEAKRGAGSLIGTGTALISTGKADCTANKFLAFGAASNVANTVGCIRFKVTPNYTGSPISDTSIMTVQSEANNAVDAITLTHTTAGLVKFNIHNSTGGLIVGVDFPWAPTALTEYNFHMNYNIIAGDSKIYIDGVEKASSTAIGTRGTTATRFRFGIINSSPASNFFIDDTQTFSTAQVVETSWPEQFTYSTNPPAISASLGVPLDGFSSFSSMVVASGSDSVNYIVDFKGVEYYYDGAAWVVSNGTHAQSNTEAEVLANQSTLDVSLGGRLKIKALLRSAEGYSTPELISTSYNYDFFQEIAAEDVCLVYGYILENSTPIPGAIVKATSKTMFFNNGSLVRVDKTATTSDVGYFEIVLPVTPERVKIDIAIEAPLGGVIFRKNGEIEVPNLDTASLDSLMNI